MTLSALGDPFDSSRSLATCSCGQHTNELEHNASENSRLGELAQLNRLALQTAAMRALFPRDQSRRRFLRAVGSASAFAAISEFIPFSALEALAQDTKQPLEKKDLKIGFIAITCATPLIMADPLGFYRSQGLNVTLNKTAGWALIRDKMVNHEHDASHFLSPMPLAMSIGLGASEPMNVATIQNVNGQAITLHVKHKERRNPKEWKGFKFAVPFEYSMHNFLLRYYLAEYGVDPDVDIQIRVTPPPEMVANLRAGNIDGFLGPDPFNQRAVYDEVGFIHILSKEIWNGHPCCAFGTSDAFVKENPNTFAALYRAVLNSAQMARDPRHRTLIAKSISPTNYLNQPETVVEQVLTGKFADGLGNVRTVPDRIGFDPFPWQSMAVWMLTQMQRWGYLKGEVNYRQVAEKVFLATDARKRMAELEMKAPPTSYAKATIMDKVFDPAAPDKYLASFAIRKQA